VTTQDYAPITEHAEPTSRHRRTVADPVVAAAGVDGDADAALTLAAELGSAVPSPGSGQTWTRWQLLADVSAADLTAGRVLEAHLDALAILDEAGEATGIAAADIGVSTASTWGVFAAEGPGVRVTAEPAGDGWLLDGTKPWCSLADRLSHGLITAHTAGGRRLFAVALDAPQVRAESTGWVSRGLSAVTSMPIHLDRAPAVPVGDDNWYLRRPGFAWGGMGVAACWYGGAVGISRRIARHFTDREPDQLGCWQLGSVDVALHRARTVLQAAAADVDDGRAEGAAGVRLAALVRAVVAATAEEIIGIAGHAMGPAPLTMDEDHARRIADLTVYVRQHHAERDLAAAGRALVEAGGPRW